MHLIHQQGAPGRQAPREFIGGWSHGHPLPGTKTPAPEREQVCSTHLRVVQMVEAPQYETPPPMHSVPGLLCALLHRPRGLIFREWGLTDTTEGAGTGKPLGVTQDHLQGGASSKGLSWKQQK